MSRRANPAAVGGFVLVGLILVIAGVIVLGGGELFRQTTPAAIFFEGTVNGLQVGSPVKAQGVEVGQVTGIRAIADLESWRIFTETEIEIDPARFTRVADSHPGRYPISALVEKGLRAQLQLQSLLTGQLYVELGFLPETEARLTGRATNHPEIPAIPTTVQELEATARKVIQRLSELPLEQIVQNLNATLEGLRNITNDPAIPDALVAVDRAAKRAEAALAAVEKLATNTDARIAPVAESAVATLEEARATIGEVGATLAPGSALEYQLSVTLLELDRALQAIRSLATTLERNPRALIFGQEEE